MDAGEDFKYKINDEIREEQEVKGADGLREQGENVTPSSASKKRSSDESKASSPFVKKAKIADTVPGKKITAPSISSEGQTFSRFSQQRSSTGCRLFTERSLPQHVLKFLKKQNIEKKIQQSFNSTLQFVNSKDGTSSFELSGGCDQQTVVSIEKAILVQVDSFEEKSFDISTDQCRSLKLIPYRLIVNKLQDRGVWAAWFVNEPKLTLDICSDATRAVEKAYQIIMQLGSFNRENTTSAPHRSPQRTPHRSPHSLGTSDDPHFSQCARSGEATRIKSMSVGKYRLPCEEHVLRYLDAKGIIKMLSKNHKVEIELSLKKSYLEIKGASKNVESAYAKMEDILKTLAHKNITLNSEKLSQWQSLDPQTIISELELNNVVAGWCCHDGQLQICADNKTSTVTAGIVLRRLLHSGRCSSTAPDSAESGNFRKRFDVETEDLRFLKTTKHNLDQDFGVVVALDVNFGFVEVIGPQDQVLAAIRKLIGMVKTCVKHTFVKESMRLKCLMNLGDEDVIRALQSSGVAAGWNVKDGQLIICADTKSNIAKAANAITKLVSVFEYTQNGLSQVQTNPDWFALVKKWTQANIHAEIDGDFSLVRYAMPAFDNAVSVTVELKAFFNSLQQKTCSVKIPEKVKQLLTLDKNKNKVEADCQFEGEQPVSIQINDSSCQLTSSSQRSLDRARLHVETVSKGCSERIHTVKKRGLVSWIKTSIGKKRLAELCSLNNATFALTLESVQSEQMVPDVERLHVMDKDVSKLQLDGVLTGRGVIQSVMENVCGTKIKPGSQQVTNMTTAHSCHVYHVELEEWCGAKSLQMLKKGVDEVITAFSTLGLKKVALPAIGTGNLHYPCTVVANTMVSAVEEFLNSNPQTSIQEVTFVAYGNPQMTVAFKTAVASTKVVRPSQEKQVAKVTFTALTDADADRAVNRLKTDLKEMLMVETWDNDPLRSSISLLTAQMVAEIEKESEGNDVDVVLDRNTNSITLEGLKDGVRSVREKINRLLHQLKGSGDQIPANWRRAESNAGKLMARVDSVSTEYKRVSTSFRASSSTPSVNIIEILRVQNIELYKMYGAWKETVTKQVVPGVTVDVERSLWHGTDFSSVQCICKGGFNRSFAGKNGTAYGKGSYFSTSAKYSIEYSKDIDDKYIILAKVVTGKHMVGNSSTDSKSLPEGYHSTTNSQSSPSIFVVYHDASAYPEYVIKFRC